MKICLELGFFEFNDFFNVFFVFRFKIMIINFI